MTSLIGRPGGSIKRPKSGAQRQKEWYARGGKESHHERVRVLRRMAHSTREFIAWDGEGVNTNGPGKPQSYVLFGSSKGDPLTRTDGRTLNFVDIAEHILDTDRKFPACWHVGFAFDYDVNQIIRSLPFATLEYLNQRGAVRYGPYRLEWRKGKSFRITKRTDEQSQSVTIYDVFSFFATSFIKAAKSILGTDREFADTVDFVARGKSSRKEFTLDELDSLILPYWREEIRLLAIVVSRFRDLLYSAGFDITKWYGPGAIASLVLRRHGIADHMSIPPEPVIESAQYAYAGGRFELFRVGRYCGPVWAIDINSAYPDALCRLPSLKAPGYWEYRSIERAASEVVRANIDSFAIYHVRLSHPQYRNPWHPNTPPGPLFFRTDKGEMRYPWHVKGWYWGPEVENLCHPKIAPYAYIYGAWVFTPASEEKPFTFLADMYTMRREWKTAGRLEQLALKLAMNSIYGKLAQRVGWEHSGTAPRWHQLEWAGWVTSYVRAELFRVLWSLGNDIISVETDGIYTTRDPNGIGISASPELGAWSVTRYDEIIYLQSGTYFARTGDEWISKYRGLDPESLDRGRALDYLRAVNAGEGFPSITGTTTRYTGLAAALMQAGGDPGKFRGRHGVWDQDKDKDIAPGTGKRQHHVDSCIECVKGIAPYDYPHYMSINVDLLPDGINESTRHYLPWRDGKEFPWREEAILEEARLFVA